MLKMCVTCVTATLISFVLDALLFHEASCRGSLL